MGRGAIGVIRVSGTGVVSLVAAVSSIPDALEHAEGYTVHRGAVVDPDTDNVMDEVLFLVFREPKSYTGEESVEIHCHGSPPGMEAILELLRRRGARTAQPGEFTFRAFVNGKVDLTRAEAVNELVNARTDAAQRLAMHRLSGAVFDRIDRAKEKLVRVMAGLAAQIDYPDDETGELPMEVETVRRVRRDLTELRGTYATGRLYQEGALVVIAGRTNAGKSSLFNALLREDRAIVSEIHGTTRDYLEVAVSMEGIPVRLVDTAGLRESGERLESEGIRRSRELLSQADAAVYVVDGEVGLTSEDEAEISRLSAELAGAVVAVVSKDDLVSRREDARPRDVACHHVSSTTGAGIHDLPPAVAAVIRARRTGAPGPGAETGSAEAGAAETASAPEGAPSRGSEGSGAAPAVIDSARQRDLLDRAVRSLDAVEEAMDATLPADVVAVDVQEAISALGEITGEVTSSDVLDVMFGSFCLGK